MRAILGFILAAATAVVLPAAKPLNIYFVDVEGGQATLVVTPSGESVLVDAGWPGFNGRDADRIAAAAKKAGVKKIDYLVITHYHRDHVGGVPQLAQKLPIRTFVDHGANTETSREAEMLFKDYLEERNKGQHIEVKPGAAIPLKGVEVKVVTAAGDMIDKALAGGGTANPACANQQPKAEDKTENARSVGVMLTFGKFRFLDLGDLTWNKETALACPENRLGPVDVYLTTHHGLDQSNAPAIVNALHPKVAIMNNGARKGGSPSAWQVVKSSPGLQDLWQIHYSVAGGKEHNVPDTFIANLDEKCEGEYVRVTVMPDGSFTVYNSRNKFTKSYK